MIQTNHYPTITHTSETLTGTEDTFFKMFVRYDLISFVYSVS